MFQSPDGDFVYSDKPDQHHSEGHVFLFQSPDGDFVYSDAAHELTHVAQFVCFNPLTGISSILTSSTRFGNSRTKEFQSPDGDFVYSDPEHRALIVGAALDLFQSPDGDFVYSDTFHPREAVRSPICFNPLTGISSILTIRGDF